MAQLQILCHVCIHYAIIRFILSLRLYAKQIWAQPNELSLILPSPPIVSGGPEALFYRLEVRQRRGRAAAADGLSERQLGTEVGRRERGVDHALETVMGDEFH